MSTTVTSHSGPRTRSRVKSSSETLRPVEEMVGAMEQLAGRRRGAPKGIPPVTPDDDPAADSEILPSSPLSEPFLSGNAEPVALQVWNEMFEEDTFEKIAEGSDYIRNNVANLLQTSQLVRMATEVTDEIKRKKDTFIRTKGNDVVKLREKLHRLFTTIIIRRVKSELAESRQAVEERIAEISADHEKKNESWNWVIEKQKITKTRVHKAQIALPELLDLAAHYLARQTQSQDEEPGSRREILQHMVQFLTTEVQNGTLSLPEVINMGRTEESPKAIYREDFDNLPQEVKDKFEQVDRLIMLANQAASEEELEMDKHKELTQGDDDANLQEQYVKERKKLGAIVAAEKIADKVMDAGTIWKYESKSAPGELKKRSMTCDMTTKLTNNLRMHIE